MPRCDHGPTTNERGSFALVQLQETWDSIPATPGSEMEMQCILPSGNDQQFAIEAMTIEIVDFPIDNGG